MKGYIPLLHPITCRSRTPRFPGRIYATITGCLLTWRRFAVRVISRSGLLPEQRHHRSNHCCGTLSTSGGAPIQHRSFRRRYVIAMPEPSFPLLPLPHLPCHGTNVIPGRPTSPPRCWASSGQRHFGRICRSGLPYSIFGDKVNDVSPDGKRGGGGSDNNTNPITTDVPVNTYLFAVKTYFTEKRNNIRALFSMGVRL